LITFDPGIAHPTILNACGKICHILCGVDFCGSAVVDAMVNLKASSWARSCCRWEPVEGGGLGSLGGGFRCEGWWGRLLGVLSGEIRLEASLRGGRGAGDCGDC